MKLRVDELHEVERLIGYIEGELSYNHSLLYEAVFKASERADEKYSVWLSFLLEQLNQDMAGQSSVNAIWQESMRVLEQSTHLKWADLELIKGFGLSFGYLDINTQQNAIKLEQQRLQEAAKKLSGDLQNRMKLAFSMSALSGLIVVIVLL